MAMLTDTDLEPILCTERDWKDTHRTLHIFPFSAASLTPVGYDLRVGNLYSSSYRPGLFQLSTGESIIVRPGETVLITTLETVDMPKSKVISGLISSKVAQVSQGLSHISTTIDADWEGSLLIALHNHSKVLVKLAHGEKFATTVFFKNETPATRSGGHPPGRHDVLLKQWFKESCKANNRDRFRFWAQPAMVLVSLYLGFRIFGNSPGIAAAVAVGVALSQIIRGR